MRLYPIKIDMIYHSGMIVAWTSTLAVVKYVVQLEIMSIELVLQIAGGYFLGLCAGALLTRAYNIGQHGYDAYLRWRRRRLHDRLVANTWSTLVHMESDRMKRNWEK